LADKDLPGEILTAFPHAAEIGIRMVSAEAGVAVLAIPYDSRLVGDPASGVLHGGVVTTLLDTCCGVAVITSPAQPVSTATLDLRIDYMRPATPQQPVFARAHCYRTTRQIAFVRAVAYHDDPDDPIASAAGAFMIETKPKKKDAA
jgi:uncharacterized protein (TIGR00369 family)